MIYGTMPTGQGTEAATTGTLSQTLDAEFEQAWMQGPLQSAIDADKLSRERGSTAQVFGPMGYAVDWTLRQFGIDNSDFYAPTAKITKEQADERLKAEGLSGRIKVPAEGMRSGELALLMRERKKELARQAVLAHASEDIGTDIARFGSGLLANVVDPVNAAVMFTPVVGQMRYSWMLAGASNVLARTAIRAGVGALEGAVGSALVEPLIYSTQTDFQRDYGLLNSFLNVAMGSATGAALHGLGGGLREVIGRQNQTWRSMAEWVAERRSYGREFGPAGVSLDDWVGAAFARDRGGRLPEMSRADYERWLAEFSQKPPERLSPKEFEAWAKEFGGQPFIMRPHMRLTEGVNGDARAAALDLASSHLAEGKHFDGATVWRYDRASQRMQRHLELSEGEQAEIVRAVTPDKFQPLGPEGDFGIARERIGLPVEGTKMPEALVSSPVGIGDSVRWVRPDGTDKMQGPAKVYAVSSDGRYAYVQTETGRQRGGIPVDEIEVTGSTDAAGRTWDASIRWGDEIADVARGQTRADAERIAREELARFYHAEIAARPTHEMELRNAGEALAQETRQAGRPERDLFFSEPQKPPEPPKDATGKDALAAARETDPEIRRIEGQMEKQGRSEGFKAEMERADEEIARTKDAWGRLKEYVSCLVRNGL